MQATINAAWYGLASQYHSGQFTSLYAFASSGTPTLGLASEVAEALAIARKHHPEDVAYLAEFHAWAEAWEDSPRLELADDGTLDTVLECRICGATLRYSEFERNEDGTPSEDAMADAESEHADECEG